MQSIEIKNFGPIDYFKAELDKNLNIYIGQQATGKSTIVKLIYFCTSVKDELYNFLLDEKQLTENDSNELLQRFTTILVEKFKDFFGSTRHYKEYEMKFVYGIDKEIIIRSDKSTSKHGKINFSPNLSWLVRDIILANKIYYRDIDTTDVLVAMKNDELYRRQTMVEVNKIFELDYYISLFIPAGRYWATVNSGLDKQVNTDYLLQKFSNYVNVIKRSFKTKLEDIVSGETHHLKQIAVKEETINLLISMIRQVLKGDYLYGNFEEKIVFGEGNDDFVYLHQASSGQQEVIWMLLTLFDVILRGRKLLIIIEEPEAHIFPEAQKLIMEIIALLINCTDSKVFVTTHSPYILTSTNLLIHSAKVENKIKNENPVIDERLRINSSQVASYLLSRNGAFKAQPIIDEESGTIRAENIDRVSDIIYEQSDRLLYLEAETDEEMQGF